jgi:hypothetical protein
MQRKTTQPFKHGLKPVAELAARRNHGDRLRYMAGCRCDLCRRANTDYELMRAAARKAGDWNGIVPAARSRKHMLKLSEQGIGRRAVQAVTDIAASVLQDIRTGAKKNIRARTERKILAVTPEMASEGALISAAPTWNLIRQLLAKGYTKTQLAKMLSCETRALQISQKQVRVSTADAIARLYKKLEEVNFTTAKNYRQEEILPANTHRIKPGVIEHRMGE